MKKIEKMNELNEIDKWINDWFEWERERVIKGSQGSFSLLKVFTRECCSNCHTFDCRAYFQKRPFCPLLTDRFVSHSLYEKIKLRPPNCEIFPRFERQPWPCRYVHHTCRGIQRLRNWRVEQTHLGLASGYSTIRETRPYTQQYQSRTGWQGQ